MNYLLSGARARVPARSCILAVLVILVFSGCGACRTASDGTDGERPIPPAAPPPGTARFIGQAIGCDQSATPATCEIEIVNVLEYGTATPSLPPGTTITVDIRDMASLPPAVLGEAGGLIADALEFTAMVVTSRQADGAVTRWRLVSVAPSE